MPLSRRSFLVGLGGTAFLAAAGAHTLLGRSRGLRYCIPSAEKSDLVPGYPSAMDFSWAERLPKRMISQIPAGYRSALTVADPALKTGQQIVVPGLIHSSLFHGDQILLITRGAPSVFYSMDAQTLQIQNTVLPPDGFVFGGHLIPFVEKGTFALTLNSTTAGKYDSIAVYDGHSMRELHRFSSYGFQAHDLVMSPDQKKLYVGHYGSNFKSGPYNDGQTSALDLSIAKVTDYDKKGTIFPGSVSVIDVADGKFLERQSSFQNGPQGHLAVSSLGQILLSKVPPLLENRPDAMTHPAFNEGVENKKFLSDFFVTGFVAGTTIVVDEVHRQFLVPDLKSGQLFYGSLEKPDLVQSIDLSRYGNFGRPYSLKFHPNGIHYIVSCEEGFMALTRGSHVFSADPSFSIKLANHSHMSLG